MKQILNDKTKTIVIPKTEPVIEKPLFFEYVTKRLEREDLKQDSILEKLLDSYKEKAQLESTNRSLTLICDDYKKERISLEKEKSEMSNDLNSLIYKIKALNIHFIIRNHTESNCNQPTGIKPFDMVDFYFGDCSSCYSILSYIDETKTDLGGNPITNKYGQAMCDLVGIKLPINDSEWEGKQIN